MKLKIKNLEKFRAFANAYYHTYSRQCWNRAITSCGETPDWYDFRVSHGGFEWLVKLGKSRDFMPGWPVEIHWRNNIAVPFKRLLESNVQFEKIECKLKWAQEISDLIDNAVKHHHTFIHNR